MKNFKNLNINIDSVRDKYAFFFLCVYAFVTPLGTLFRFSAKETSLGISSIILAAIVLVYFLKSVQRLFKSKIFGLLLLLVLWLFFSSLYAENVLSAYIHLCDLAIYILFAASITKIDLTQERVQQFFLWLSAGIFLSVFLTLIDFFGIIDIPYVNELKIVTKVNGESVYQASGLFLRRSAMAAYFAIVLPAFFVMFINLKNLILKSLLMIIFFMSLLVLMFTHNAAGVIAITLSLLFYLFFGYRANFLSKIKKILVVGFLLSIFAFVVAIRFPEITEVYLFRISAHYPIQEIQKNDLLIRQTRSDNERIYFFKFALNSIKKDPFGHGLSRLTTDDYGVMDPHNMLTQIIWATGIFGFIWIGLFAYALRGILRLQNDVANSLSVYFNAIKYGLLSWMICGMAHNIIFTGLAWLFFGMLVNMRFRLCNQTQ